MSNQNQNGIISFARALDAFQNLAAKTGYGTPNLMEGSNYVNTRLTQNYQLLNTLYRGSWLARRIIDIIPKDMTKNWIQINTEVTPERLSLLDKALRKTRFKASILQGLKWGRLYGGAAGLMMIDGQEDQLEEPLDLDSIMPGDFKGLLIADRWSGVYPQLELVTDISSPEFGLPAYYQFQSSDFQASPVSSKGQAIKVHHSRVVRFCGFDLPEWERQAEMHWGMSVIEAVIEEIKKRDNTSANIAGLIFLANLRVLKMSDLGELLGGQNEVVQNNFYQTLQAQNWLMSNFGLYVMSKEDDFQQFSLGNFTGLNDIYASFMMDVSGAAQIPVTKLFGRSPAGMNATGESDLKNYYAVVEQEQEDVLRPILEKLLPVLCVSTWGDVPDDIDFMFNPVETPDDKELSDVIDKKSNSIFGAHDRGIITDRTALKELKQMGAAVGLYTNVTDEDIEAASDTPAPVTEETPEDDPEEDDPATPE